MKKIFTLLLMSALAMVMQAKDISIYVQAEKAPYIWAWESGAGGKNLTGGQWPGMKMTEKTVVKGTSFWFITFTTEKTINVIFNDGGDDGQSAVVKQTGDINDINSDHYFTYDGARAYEDVTEQYAELPDAVIEFLAVTGNHKPTTDDNDICTVIEEGKKWQLFIDLTGVEVNDDDPMGERWEFWLRPNGQGWVNEANATVEDPDNVLNHEDESNQNFVIYLDDTKCYQYTVTATWAGGKSSLNGWTIRIEKGDTSGIDGVRQQTTAGESMFSLAGQRIQSGFRGIAVKDGRKVVMK